jgi:von Willebrand factor A domain-containing protein 8
MSTRDADERLVFLLSDANLGRYGVSPEQLGETLRANPKVKAYAIFIAEPVAAAWLAEQLPLGRGFAVGDVGKLPSVISAIFTSAASESA